MVRLLGVQLWAMGGPTPGPWTIRCCPFHQWQAMGPETFTEVVSSDHQQPLYLGSSQGSHFQVFILALSLGLSSIIRK